jgi:hypothetical protein
MTTTLDFDRGWAKLDGAQLSGRFYIHLGDDSAFAAARQQASRHREERRKAPVEENKVEFEAVDSVEGWNWLEAFKGFKLAVYS